MKFIFFFFVFAVISFFVFNSLAIHHIDGSKIAKWEPWLASVLLGLIGASIIEWIFSEQKFDNDSGGGDAGSY